jgi:hypothetical protein
VTRSLRLNSPTTDSFGIGMLTDGTLNIVPPGDLARRDHP